MQGFYYNEVNYNKLCNEVSVLLSDGIIESQVAESWLEDFYVSDKYNTTRAIEKYISDVILNEIETSGLNKDNILSNINLSINNLRGRELNIKPISNKIDNIDKLRFSIVNESLIKEIIEEFDIKESLIYLRESIIDNVFKNKFIIKDSTIREVLRILESLKRIVRVSTPDSDKIKTIKSNIDRLSYLYKDYDGNDNSRIVGFKQGINIREVDNMDSKDIDMMFAKLDRLTTKLNDNMINYTITEFKYIVKLIEHSENENSTILESFNTGHKQYLDTVYKFNNLMESIFLDEESDEINLKDLVEVRILAEAICQYEANMEASSRIITKGTEKITKGVGGISARSGGMASSQSKIGQVKRGLRVVDDRASGAINKKLDDIMNITRDAKREKLITGKNTVKLGKALKTAISILVTKKGATKLLGPLWGTVASIITMLGAYALSKRTGEREKKRILLELETELKIVKEKIEDAKGDNAREDKYKLMRIQTSLEKEITRIRHGLRYY